MPKLLGKAPNQVPTNADLGTMAFQDREGINVNNAIVANLVVTGATSVNATFAVVNTTANVLFVAANGNVGIQTNAPTFPFHVYSNNAAFGAFNTTGSTNLIIDSPTAQAAAIVFRQAGGNALYLGTKASNTNVIRIGETSTGQERITFFANSTAGSARLGINNAAPTDALSVLGTVAVTNSTANVINIAANGNIGIGYTTPEYKLRVSGTIVGDANDNFFGTFAGDYVDIGNLGTTGSVYFDARGASSNVNVRIRAKGSGDHAFSTSGGSTEVVRFAANGNVGISNATPTNKLTVEGNVISLSANDAGTKIELLNRGNNTTTRFPQFVATHYSGNTAAGDSGGQPVVELIHARGSLGSVLPVQVGDILGGFNTWGSNSTAILSATRIQGVVESAFTTTATAAIQFITTNAGTAAEVVRFSANGNVGIGNATPGSKLTIAGGSLGPITIGQWGAGNYNGINLNGNNIGAGGGSDYNILADTNTLFVNRSAGSIHFRLNNVDQMHLASNGNFGIGNSAPAQKFIVNGTANIVGNTSLGGDLTVAGNLTVSGTTTYINTTTLNIGDNIITLNADVTGATAPTENAGIEINRGSAANSFFIWNETSDTWFANGGGFVVANTSANTLYVAANGNIGIGNSVPTDTLVIENNAANNIVRIRSTNSAVLFIESDSDNVDETHQAQIILSQDGGVVKGRFGYSGGGNGLAVINEFADSLTLGSNNVGAMVIVANGNIGIGNTAPAHALRIESGVLSLGNSTSNVQISIPTSVIASATNYWLNANGQWAIISGVAASGQGPNTAIQYNDSGATNGSAALTFDNVTNNVSLANTLIIGNSTVNSTISSTTASIASNSTYIGINVVANGNVGIGHGAPSSRLMVNGNFRSVLSSQGDFIISHAGLVSTAGAVSGVQLALQGGGTEAIRIDLGANVGIGNTAPAQKLQVTGSVQFSNSTASVLLAAANGNVGIGNTAPIEKLVVGGNILANNLRRYTATRTLSTTANDTVEIGTLNSTHGAHSLLITIQVTDSGFSVAKQYEIVSPFDTTTTATYRKVLPTRDTGPWASNDFDLEAYHDDNIIGLRVRRTGGSISGTLEIMIDDFVLQSEGISQDTFTPSSTTASGVAAVTDIFPGNRILSVGTGSSGSGSNAFIVQANLTTAAITSNNTSTQFQLPVTFTNSVTLGFNTFVNLGLTTSATTANQVIASFAAAAFRSVKAFIQITSGSAYQATEITLIHDGTTVYKSEYGQVFSGAVLATFDADINSGNIRILTTPTNAVTVYKGLATVVLV